jgi:hypothetical protein
VDEFEIGQGRPSAEGGVLGKRKGKIKAEGGVLGKRKCRSKKDAGKPRGYRVGLLRVSPHKAVGQIPPTVAASLQSKTKRAKNADKPLIGVFLLAVFFFPFSQRGAMRAERRCFKLKGNKKA